MNLFGRAAIAAAILCTPSLVAAQSIVTNGNFEDSQDTCSLAGWQASALAVLGSHIPDGSSCYISSVAMISYPATVQQTLSTQPGQQYRISFWGGGAGSANYIHVLFDGAFVFGQQMGSMQGYSVDVAATHSATPLTFRLANESNTEYLAKVDVSTLTTPEPGTAALLGTGLLALVPVIRRRRVASTRR